MNTQFKVKSLLKSIDFDAIESDHMIKLKPIIDQVADIDVYARFIESILNRNDKTLNCTLIEIWLGLGSDVLKLPIAIHEKSIEVNHMIFEKTILSAVLLWPVKDLIDMCSESPLVFQACTSIFNELLIKLNFTDKFTEFLINFVNSVFSQFEKKNLEIIDVYPFKYTSLLTLKVIKNKNTNLVSEHCLNQEVRKIATHCPKASICLLSHFPDLYV